MNPRLRTAIQAAKQANMPKDNISRAISKSEMGDNKNYESLRYEGFGPFNVALIIETLTDNKNRSASSIRTVLQKNGGRLAAIFINGYKGECRIGIKEEEQIYWKHGFDAYAPL